MSTIDQRHKGRIAKILNAREVVITLGRWHGIKPGMKFAILTDPIEIKDPETDELLETLERVKVCVQAVDVRNSVTVCRTYRPRVESFVNGRDQLTLGSGPPNEALDAEKFAVEQHVSVQTQTYAQEYVKVNDRVVSLEDDEA